MNDLFVILSIPVDMVIIAAFLAIPKTLVQIWDEWDERRKYGKKLDKRIKSYRSLYTKSTDDFEKNYWLTKMLNLQHERKCFKRHKKKPLKIR